MEDTLRYFFSALFQGVAAILTLGSMFYINYVDKIKTRILELEKKTTTVYYPPKIRSTENITGNIIDSLINNFPENLERNTELYRIYDLIIAEYKKLNLKTSKMENLVPIVLFEAIMILTLSLIGLFCIGYFDWLNIAAFVWGLICIILTFLFLGSLYKLIFITFDFEYVFAFNLKHIFLMKKEKD